MSDGEWHALRSRSDAITLEQRPARVKALLTSSAWVEPQVAIEVLADEITRSPMHTCGMREDESGYALRSRASSASASCTKIHKNPLPFGSGFLVLEGAPLRSCLAGRTAGDTRRQITHRHHLLSSLDGMFQD